MRQPIDPPDRTEGRSRAETTTFAEPSRRPARPSPAPLRRGANLGRYVVLDLLGEGGMGRVYSTYDPKLDRKVAVKLLNLRRQPSATGERRLLLEARALARLSHPNVITIYDVTAVDDRVLLAMEWIRGRTLKRWLDECARTHDEILTVFLQAGEGLAASHHAGLVHRDFKTSNVMVGDDGRVVVLDFGLARTTRGDDEGPVVDVDLIEHHDAPAGNALATDPTRTGAVVGTPIFMSPEQRAGEAVGPASDQYSFCVALHHALFGDYPTTTLPNRDRAPSRSGDTVPLHVERALQRGLEPKSADRYPTLRALLDDLSGRPQSRRRRARTVVIAACLGALSVLGLGGLRPSPPAPLCQSARDQLEKVWSDGDLDTLQRTFADSGVSFAEASWQATRSTLDSYGEQWIAQHTEVCEATHRRGEQSPELLDRRMACLDRRRQELGALVGLLAEGDPVVIRRAPRAALALSGLEACSDTEALLAPRLQQLAPEVRERVETLDEQLSHSKARHDAGRYREAFEIAQSVADEAEPFGAWPLIARAQLRLGIGHSALESPEPAARALERARLAAQVAGLPRVAAEALIREVRVVGYQQRRFDPAQRLARHAQALVEQLDQGLALAATLADFEGAVFLQQGEVERAAERHEVALAARRDLLGEHHAEVARTLARLGSVRRQQGRFSEALELFEEALAIQRSIYGEDHPVVAHALDQVGSAAFQRGEYERAQGLHQQALAIHRRLGPDRDSDPAVGHTLGHLANALSARGRSSEAIAHYHQALAIYEASYGPEHPNVAIILSNLGYESYAGGAGAEALAHYVRALEIQRQAYGPEHPSVAMTLFNRAGVELELLGMDAEAQRHYGQAIALWTETHGEDFYLLGSALLGQGQALLRLGQLEEGLRTLERAIAHLEGGGEEVTDLATARFALARTLGELGRDGARAQELAEAARDALIDRPDDRELLTAITRWIATSTEGPASSPRDF